MFYNTNKESTPGRTVNHKYDSNTEACCLGKKFVVLNYTNHCINVMPYNLEYNAIQDVPIMTDATALTYWIVQ